MRIIGQMVVGNGEADRYLPLVLDKLLPLVDELVISQNQTDDKTEKLIKGWGINTYHDDREWGKEQPRIKEDLLKKVAKLNPDWIIPLDADEVLLTDRKQLELLASSPNDVAYYFWCLDLWDSDTQYRYDFLFERVCFFRFLPQIIDFKSQPVHGGSAPEWHEQWGTKTNLAFLHYGLMKKEDRDRRFARYLKYDPKNKWLPKEWYQALKHDKVNLQSVASWPPEILPLNHRKKFPPIPQAMKSNEKEYYMVNRHGVPFLERERHLAQRLREGCTMIRAVGSEEMPSAPTVAPPLIKDPLECDICGFNAMHENGLKIHKTRRHKEM